jgi:hypothetical protein
MEWFGWCGLVGEWPLSLPLKTVYVQVITNQIQTGLLNGLLCLENLQSRNIYLIMKRHQLHSVMALLGRLKSNSLEESWEYKRDTMEMKLQRISS